MSRARELVVTPICEAALILVAGLAAWLTQQPLLFASLGPTAFELIESPERQSAHPYNVLIGHLIGVIMGFVALAVTHAWDTPSASTGHVTLLRLWAAVLAALLTVLGTLLVRATQPAAVSTTLLIASGVMQQWRDAVLIMASILLITLLGEPLRRWRERTKQQ